MLATSKSIGMHTTQLAVVGVISQVAYGEHGWLHVNPTTVVDRCCVEYVRDE
jgi:hypothetical protein